MAPRRIAIAACRSAMSGWKCSMIATGRPRKNRTYCASWWRYIGSPSASASYSASQSSPRNPLCTKRTVVVPDRPSTVNLHRVHHAVRPGRALVGEVMRRVPGRDRRLGDLAAERSGGPRRRAWARPRWARRSTSRRAVRRWSGPPTPPRAWPRSRRRFRSGTGAACQASFGAGDGAWVGTLGWMATRTRCVRPRGAASSW